MNTIRRPIVLCSVINGILLGVFLYFALFFWRQSRLPYKRILISAKSKLRNEAT